MVFSGGPKSMFFAVFYDTNCILGVSGRPDAKVFRGAIYCFFGELLKREFAVKYDTKCTCLGLRGAKQHKKMMVKTASN